LAPEGIVGTRLRVVIALLSVAIAAACIFEGTKKPPADAERVARPF
jgi:hypothetical protein